MSIAVYENAYNYELKWKMLEKAIKEEIHLLKRSIKQSVKEFEYAEALYSKAALETLEFFQMEMDNIKEKGCRK
jgi:hypothetical protein